MFSLNLNISKTINFQGVNVVTENIKNNGWNQKMIWNNGDDLKVSANKTGLSPDSRENLKFML